MGSAFLFLIWQDKLTTHGESAYFMKSTQIATEKKALENEKDISKLRYWVLTLRGQVFFPHTTFFTYRLILFLNILNLI